MQQAPPLVISKDYQNYFTFFYVQKGCEFCGTEKEVKEHMEICLSKLSIEEQVGSLSMNYKTMCLVF